MKLREEVYNVMRETKKQIPIPTRSRERDYFELSSEEAKMIDLWLEGHCECLPSVRAAAFIKRYYH